MNYEITLTHTRDDDGRPCVEWRVESLDLGGVARTRADAIDDAEISIEDETEY